MKKFNIGQLVISIIMFLLLVSGLFLYFIVNEITQNIGLSLLCVGGLSMFILIAYTFGGWAMEDDYEERLSSLRKGHRILEEYQEKKIAKQNEEIKKLKKRIQRLIQKKK